MLSASSISELPLSSYLDLLSVGKSYYFVLNIVDEVCKIVYITLETNTSFALKNFSQDVFVNQSDSYVVFVTEAIYE